jgi:heme A synthase
LKDFMTDSPGGGTSLTVTEERRSGGPTFRPADPGHRLPLAPTGVPRWLHVWAVLTVCAALPLVLLGAQVTTMQVGMVDAQGFRMPWHLLTVPLEEMGLGYLVEHSHRLAGFVVGTCSIVLALGLSFCSRHRVIRWLGWLALGMVTTQGMLGKYRVDLHALMGPELALVHGCFAQLVFATLVGVAVVTSRSWLEQTADRKGSLGWLALVAPVLVYVQIVFGAVVRHHLDRLAQRLHVLFAFVVAGVLLFCVKQAWERGLKRSAGLLAFLLAAQLTLGVEAWLTRFGSGVLAELRGKGTLVQDLVRSGHFVVGSLLFAATAALALFAFHPGSTLPRTEGEE